MTVARAKARARLLLVGSGVAFAVMATLVRFLKGDGFSPGQLTVLRFVVGAALSLALFRARPGLFAPRHRVLLWTRGISGGIVVVLYFFALQRIPAGEAGMLFNVFPVIATVLGAFAFRERPTVHLLAGLAAATTGVLLVLGGGTLRFAVGAGEAFALGGAFFAAVSAVQMRAMRSSVNAPTIFFYFCLGGLPVALPFAVGPWPTVPAAWALGVLSAVAGFVGQIFMAEAYGALAVAEAAVWLQLLPLIQYVVAAALLGEAMTAAGTIGLLVGIAGVVYGTVLGQRRAPAPPARHAASPGAV